jgi:acyl-CoA synthetase (AMP-forming)/AMP-acid ligase II
VYRPVTAADWVSMVSAAQDTDDPAVVTGTETWSGRRLLGAAATAAEWLLGLAPRPDRPVPALLETGGPALALVLAGAAAGRPIAPLGTRLTGRELGDCVERLGARVIVAQRPFARLAGEVARSRACRVVIVPDLPGSAGRLRTPEPTETAFVLHTSGTTGAPKAVAYRHAAVARRVQVNRELQGLRPGRVIATASPFHHIAGLGTLVVALAAGVTVVPVPRFGIEVWHELAALRVSHVFVVPTMLEMLMRAGALPMETLRVLQYGGAPIHPETLRRAMAELPGVDFLTLYGQTEGSPVTWLSPADHRAAAAGEDRLLASVGRAVPGVEVRLGETDGDGVGEILARGGHLVGHGPDGWLHTGDLGRLDERGYLFLSGRRGEKIIRGGENVYPLEVENVLAAHPGVAEAAVVGVPDRLYGEIVKAFVVATDPALPPDPGELEAFARCCLAGFKVPVEWEFLPSLPRNAGGKVLRAELAG